MSNKAAADAAQKLIEDHGGKIDSRVGNTLFVDIPDDDRGDDAFEAVISLDDFESWSSPVAKRQK